MKKEFTAPLMSIAAFEAESVVTASNDLANEMKNDTAANVGHVTTVTAQEVGTLLGITF